MKGTLHPRVRAFQFYPDEPTVRDERGAHGDADYWWNWEPASRIEREEVGNSPPTVACAVFLPDVVDGGARTTDSGRP